MREIKGKIQGEEFEYIPESFDNKSSDKPVKVKLKSPTERERRRCMAMLRTHGSGELSIEDAFRVHEFCAETFVISVENYKVRGKDILTGKDLAEFGETDLLIELSSVIIAEQATPEEEKKR